MTSRRASSCRVAGWTALVLFLVAVPGTAQVETTDKQDQTAALVRSVQELARQVQQLNAEVSELQMEVARSHEETRDLRRELENTLEKLTMANGTSGQGPAAAPAPQNGLVKARKTVTNQSPEPSELSQRVSKLEENEELLRTKVDDQYQTKVESASRYRMRLSGIVLLNAFENIGKVDNQDVPNIAFERGVLDSSGSLGATVRQSELGFEAYGPRFMDARTSADLQMDLFGGFPNTLNGVTEGIMRLRTATVRMDWDRASIVVGQDAPFFSPLSPTSIASLGYPAFSYAGNLWTWIPQVRAERRVDLSGSNSISFEGGLLDPLSGEPPPSQFYRQPQAGERSRQPAYGTRLAWTHGADDRVLTLGIGGYYSRQDYGGGRTADAWAGTADWSIPLTSRFGLTGEFYRGRAIGGLGGATGRSAIFSGPVMDPASALAGLNTIGGWTQLKFKASEAIEFNAAYGEDNPFSSDLHRFPSIYGYAYPAISRNQSELFNVIYRPRTDLILSLEYRHINTREAGGDRYTAGHLNLGVGVLF
jgi:hypothetical protein